ncbi:MAG: alpha/beta hydrolase [Telluria sp.]
MNRTMMAAAAAWMTAANLAWAAPQGITESEVTLDTGSGILHGTLELPRKPAPVPALLIVAGSGPTDRDGNSTLLPGKNDSLKMLADALAQAGIATVRYDKRGVGASKAALASEETLRFDDIAADAAGWLRQMKQDRRFARVSILGHSEGSLVAMVAAQKEPAASVVSLSGPAQAAPALLRAQLKDKLPPALVAENERVLSALEKGQLVPDAPAQLAMLYRPSVQPYLISWFRHAPAAEIARLQAPVLVVNGSTDLQVPLAEANALAQANPRAQLVVVPGMNHVLKEASGTLPEQLPSYSDPSKPLAPGLAEKIAVFLR